MVGSLPLPPKGLWNQCKDPWLLKNVFARIGILKLWKQTLERGRLSDCQLDTDWWLSVILRWLEYFFRNIKCVLRIFREHKRHHCYIILRFISLHCFTSHWSFSFIIWAWEISPRWSKTFYLVKTSKLMINLRQGLNAFLQLNWFLRGMVSRYN